MKIQVIFSNGTTGTVSTEDLDNLLNSKAVIGVQRSEGWAMVGMHTFRHARDNDKTSWKNRRINHRYLDN